MRTLFIVHLALALGLVPAPTLHAQETPSSGEVTFRSDVRLVRVDVQVLQDNRPVTGLTKDDFLLKDEGQPQAIQFFSHQTEPLAIVLLLDISGSMRRSLEQMEKAADQALAYLTPEDRVSVIAFSRESLEMEVFTKDRAAVRRAIRRAATDDIDLGGGTLINTAVRDAAKHLRDFAGPEGRRAIVILTDNLSMEYRQPTATVIGSLYNADTVLNAIVVGKADRPRPPEPGRAVNPDYTLADVFRLAEETGGEAIKADRVEQSFPDMIARIRDRYQLQFPAPGGQAGSFRRVDVSLSPAARARYPRAVLRARSGYFVKE